MRKQLLPALLMFTVIGCSSYPPIKSEEKVDLDKFMGDWYVIANIPTFIEEGAHNAIESYAFNEDGSIATTFSFYQDSFDGEKKVYNPTGFVKDTQSNAIWGMQFIWPFKADYRILYVSEDYSKTIIGRIKRDYVWFMARTPQISEQDYQELLNIIEQEGYDTSKVRKVPQSWPQERS
jgi:apolipoprotein D and lipocalin family protein